MPNIPARDANNTIVYLEAIGTGTDADPFRQLHGVGSFLPIVFRATTNGTGYSTDDRLGIRLNSDGTFSWYNLSTGSPTLIAVVPVGDRVVDTGGSATSSDDFEFIDREITVAGAGLTVGQVVRERVGPTGSTWTLLQGNAEVALPGAVPDYSNTVVVGGSGGTTSGGGLSVTYSVSDGAGGTTSTELQGGWDLANNQIYPIGSDTPIAIAALATANAGDAVNVRLFNPASAEGALTGTRMVEFPATGDGVAAASATQFLRPEAPTGAISFFSGANTIPANTTYLILEVLVRDELVNSASTDANQLANVQALLNEVGLYTLDGAVPAPSDTVPNGSKLTEGYAYVFTAAEAADLRILANADPAALVNERGFVSIKFYSGSVPGVRAYQVSRRNFELLEAETNLQVNFSPQAIGVATGPLVSDTGAAVNTWVEIFAPDAGRKSWAVQVPSTESAPIEVGVGAAGSEVVLFSTYPGAGPVGFAETALLEVDKRRIVARSAAASVGFIAHAYTTT